MYSLGPALRNCNVKKRGPDLARRRAKKKTELGRGGPAQASSYDNCGTFSWTDDPLENDDVAEPPTYGVRELEPPDVCPPPIDTTAREGEDDEGIIDDDDDPDEDDAPPAPKEAPAGFRLAASPPPPEALAFLKGASPADALVDRLLLFKWPVVGWCVGKIMSRNRRNTDARKTAKLADGSTAKKNFSIFYEIDGEEVGSVLRADEYGGDEDFSWVLLEPAEGA